MTRSEQLAELGQECGQAPAVLGFTTAADGVAAARRRREEGAHHQAS